MRLTTNTPQGNLEQSLNLFYAKDGKTWVRGYGENGTDIALLDLMRKLICRYMEPDEIPETMSDEDVPCANADLICGNTILTTTAPTAARGWRVRNESLQEPVEIARKLFCQNWCGKVGKGRRQKVSVILSTFGKANG